MRGSVDSIILLIWGLCIGVFVSAGVCALFTTVGIVTRIAWVTKTVERIRCYETCILIGTATSNFIYIWYPKLNLINGISQCLLGIMGAFFGIFVGCLAMSLEEYLDVSTIFFRRIHLHKYFKYIILAVAIGKFIGNILFYT